MSMRLSILIVALITACLVGAGCDRRSACSICGAAQWTTFSPTNERFSVLMPLKPTASTATANTAAGPFPVYLFTATPSKGYGFAVSHNTFPPEVDTKDAEALLDRICKQVLSRDGQLVSSRQVALHGIPGRELRYEKKGQALVSQRTYLMDHEAYQVYCVMPKTAICQTHANEFLASFDLKQK
jgi:hypothetical protein